MTNILKKDKRRQSGARNLRFAALAVTALFLSLTILAFIMLIAGFSVPGRAWLS